MRGHERRLRVDARLLPTLRRHLGWASGIGLILLTAGLVSSVIRHEDTLAVALTPLVVTLAVLFTPRLRALELILATAMMRFILDAYQVDRAGPGYVGVSVTVISAILGMVGAAARPWLTSAGGDAASAIARRFQGIGTAGQMPEVSAEAAQPLDGGVAPPIAGLLEPGAGRLSRRQQEVVALILQGLTAREVGVRLFISERTVETHLANVYERLGVHCRLELVRSQERTASRELPGGVGAGSFAPGIAAATTAS